MWELSPSRFESHINNYRRKIVLFSPFPPPPTPTPTPTLHYYRLLIDLFRVPVIRKEEIMIFTGLNENKMGRKKKPQQIKTIMN